MKRAVLSLPASHLCRPRMLTGRIIDTNCLCGTKVEGIDPERREKLISMLDIDLDWRMNTVSDGQRRRVQICMGLLKPYQVSYPSAPPRPLVGPLPCQARYTASPEGWWKGPRTTVLKAAPNTSFLRRVLMDRENSSSSNNNNNKEGGR